MTRAQAPFWFIVRHPGPCKKCGATVAQGETALYDIATQEYLACAKCGEPPDRQPVPVKEPARLPEPRAESKEVNDIFTPPSRAGLVAELEAFARRNCRNEIDIPAKVDAMLAALMRAVL